MTGANVDRRRDLVTGAGALAAVAGGLLWAVGLATDFPHFGERSWLAFLASIVGLLVGATVIPLRQGDRTGLAARLEFAMLATPLLLTAVTLAVFGAGGMFVAAYLLFYLLPLGALPFALAMRRRAGTASRRGVDRVALGAVGLPLIVTWNEPRFWGTAFAALFGIGWALLGIDLWRDVASCFRPPPSDPRPARADP